MKKAIIIIIIMLSCALLADDGSWSTDFRIMDGPIYSQTEHPDISLEKEFLWYRGPGDNFTDSTEVFFLFKNTSLTFVSVDAGFPVVFKKKVRPMGNDYIIEFSKYEDTPSMRFFKYFYGTRLMAMSTDEYNPNTYAIGKNEIAERRIITDSDFRAHYNKLVDFDISQNSKKLSIEEVVIEPKVKTISGEAILFIYFHFRHTLKFSPREASVVKVNYRSNNQIDGGYGSAYEYRYVLWTGATWKGSIRSLLLAVPQSIKPDIPTGFRYLGLYSGTRIFEAKDYEPGADDSIVVKYAGTEHADYMAMHEVIFQKKHIKRPGGAAQSFVRVKGASSYLKQSGDVFTTQGIITVGDFGPESLFDGIRETPWCEGVKGDGIGQWVKFELLTDVKGGEIQNGFARCLYEIFDNDYHTYFQRNSRVKSLAIESDDKKISVAIDLKDIREKQRFNAYLPKGTYTVTIRGVYPGTQWQDTCLGEITFFTNNPDIRKHFAQEGYAQDFKTDFF